MLDLTHPFGHAPRPYLSKQIAAAVVTEAWQLAAYYRVRRDIFAAEQGLFAGSDVDERDAHATPIVALSQLAGMADEVVGVVRIYRAEGDTWYGGRLGVCERYRRVGAVGGALIHTAVSTAHAWGCRSFFATVQPRNVRYFERYHFRVEGEVDVCHTRHALMRADLDSYPACPRAQSPEVLAAKALHQRGPKVQARAA